MVIVIVLWPNQSCTWRNGAGLGDRGGRSSGDEPCLQICNLAAEDSPQAPEPALRRSTERAMYAKVLVCGLLAVTLAAGCGGGSQSCVGTDHCACNPNGTCNTGLSCLSNMCVTAPADAGIDVPATGGSSAGGVGGAVAGTGGIGGSGGAGAAGAGVAGTTGTAGAGGGGIAGAAGGRGGTGGTTGAAGTGGVTPAVCRFHKDGVQEVHDQFAYVTLARGAATVSCNSGGRSLRFTVTSTAGSIEARTYSCSDSLPVSVTMIYDDGVGMAYWANWTAEGLGQPCTVTFEQIGGRARGTFSGMLRGRKSDDTLETINVTGGVFDLMQQ